MPAHVIEQWVGRIESLQPTVKEILEQERMEKQMRVAEMEANKTQNMVEHHTEIHARPAKTWFQTPAEKKMVQEASRAARMGPDDPLVKEAAAKKLELDAPKRKLEGHRLTRRKRRRMEHMKRLEQFAKEDAAKAAEKAKVEGGDADAAAENSLNAWHVKMSSGGQRASNKARRQTIQREEQLSTSAAVGIERRPGLTPKQTNKEKKQKEKRKERQNAAGDSAATGAFDEDLNDGGRRSKKTEKRENAARAGNATGKLAGWTDFDATKIGRARKLKKMMGSGSFKSKKKFKRR